MCSYSFANKSKVVGVQMNEHAIIFSLYLRIYLEMCTFTQQKFVTWQHTRLHRRKKKWRHAHEKEVWHWRNVLYAILSAADFLIGLHERCFLPINFSYVHRSVGLSLNCYAKLMYIFILCISIINKKLKISEPQQIKVIFQTRCSSLII